MKKLKLFNLIAALIVFFAGSNTTDASEVRIHDHKLTVQVSGMPLRHILREFVETGVRVRLDPTINPVITASINEWDVENGLKSILKSVDHVLIWETKNGNPRLSEIQVFRPGRKDAMKPLRQPDALKISRNEKDGSYYVKDEVIIRIRGDADLARLKKIFDLSGAKIVWHHEGLGLMKLKLPEGTDILEFVERIPTLKEIEKAEPNYAYPISKPLIIQGMATADAPDSANRQSVKGDVPIAVLDTGYDPAFGREDFVLASMDALNPEYPIQDSEGHGTQMVLIASGQVQPYGISPNSDSTASVIPIRAIDENGFTSSSNILDSIDFALEHNARVMSISWGSETRSDFMENAMDYARSKGLIIVASAGNEATGKPVYPAAYPAVIGVGALNPDGSFWEKSNYGSFVNIYAPGYASFPVGYQGDPGTYAGTSIATAFVANAIANYLEQNPNATTNDIFQNLNQKKIRN